MLFELQRSKPQPQSLLGVYFQAVVYYDQLLSYLVLALQYLLFIYKYNVLVYSKNTVIVELLLLSILLLINPLRLALATAGGKGRKGFYLLLFIGLDVLLLLGCLYVAFLQTNALFLEQILSIILLVFAAADLLLAIILGIYHRIRD